MDHTESNSTPFKFGPGRIVRSYGVELRLAREWRLARDEVDEVFSRWLTARLVGHFGGFWGSVDPGTRRRNEAVASDQALMAGGTILGLHRIPEELAGTTMGWLVFRSSGVAALLSPTGEDLVLTEVLLLEELLR